VSNCLACTAGRCTVVRTMPPVEIPDFETASCRFRTFLGNSGFSGDILWVWREDFTARGRRVHVRSPIPEGNRTLAEQRYNVGRQLGYGVSLEMFALLDSKPCCFVRFASSQQEAGDTFCVGLTLKHRSRPLLARGVRSRAVWRVLQWYNHRPGHSTLVDDVPSRHALHP
jgi:hypothetical protein